MYKNKMIISEDEYTNKDFKKVTEEEVKGYSGTIYALTKMEPLKSNRAFLVPREDYLFLKKEDISFLRDELQSEFKAPDWLKNAIDNHRVISLNTSYPDFLDALEYTAPKKWRINVVGLGDVGSTLLTGLKLLGKGSISQLGIYDLDNRKVQRMNFELSQIMSCSGEENSIAIKMLDEASLFDCDMFVFCVSVYVPPVGKENCDVRMIQYEGNRKILNHYGTLARKAQFKGIFSVVSDPVDMLSRSLFDFTNRDSSGNYDFKGLAAEQIRGYGLGVMNARAAYYDSLAHKSNYPSEGRAFGPHGEGLIIANSIKNYDDKI